MLSISYGLIQIRKRSNKKGNGVCENVANFMMVSNNNVPIKIESTDRRYMVTKTSDEKRGDFDYFDKLCDSFTPEFYENLFIFFLKLDITKANLRRIPNSEAKETIKEAILIQLIALIITKYRLY